MVWKFHSRDALLDRLARPNASKEHVFLFGAALTAPPRVDMPGVPGVAGVIDLIREHYRNAYDSSALTELESTLDDNPTKRYQAAFEHLQGRGNVEDANRIIRSAVLRARNATLPGTSVNNIEDLQRLDWAGWQLSPAVTALGQLLANKRAGFAPLVLTTNFDPLIEVSIERANGHPYWSALDTDGRLDQVNGAGCHIVHLHGHWLGSDTLHTSVQLGLERPQLQASLEQVLANRAVVVIGYGGWDDVFARALSAVLDNSQKKFEVLWAFHPADEQLLRSSAEPLLNRLKSGYQHGRVTLFKDVDLHWLLPKLLQRLTVSPGTRASGAASSPASYPSIPYISQSDPQADSSPATATAIPISEQQPAVPRPSIDSLAQKTPTRRALKFAIPVLVGALAIYYIGSAGLISCEPQPPVTTPAAIAHVDTAEETVRAYWQSLNSKNYQSAWNRLSPSFQSHMHTGGYADYERTHRFDGVCSVQVDHTTIEQLSPDNAVVRASLYIVSGSGCSKERTQNYSFTMVKDASGEGWLIDSVGVR